MKTLTVYTPTFNRGELLKRAYDSLCRQSSDDFLWLIVDDGSTDETEKIVSSFIAEGRIEIQYVKKANGGKHTATNMALQVVETPLIMIALDSDDYLKPFAVEKIISCYKSAPELSGYIFMKEDTKGTPLFRTFSKSLLAMSWRDAVGGGHFDGEALLVLKSDYAAGFPSPVIEGEHFFTEGYSYLCMTEPFFWSRESVYVAEYLDDGYTTNIIKSFKENPTCYRMYNNLRLKCFSSFTKRFKYAAYYVAFSKLSGEKNVIKEASRPWMCVFAYLFGLAFCAYIKNKNN